MKTHDEDGMCVYLDIQWLKKAGAVPFIMVDPAGKITLRVRNLRRWGCRAWITMSCDIDDYKKGGRMSLMTYDLSDDLQMAVRMMGDGRMTLTVWDDRLKERRCCLEWDEVKHLMHTLKACEQVDE